MGVKVVLVDDHPLLRSGLRAALEQEGEFTVVGEACTGRQAVAEALALQPELVVMDLHLPDLNGIEATRQILAALPGVKVLVFSGDSDRALVDSALQAGACGYLLKESLVAELLRAIKLVLSGRLYLSPEVSAEILADYRRSLGCDSSPRKPAISLQETHLLRLIAQGKRNKEIANELGLRPNSVETYRVRVMKKLGCSSTADLVRYAIREGIASL
jgi:DNA-binding NarL/FixJ family response regulator